MFYRNFGNTGLKVSALSLGSWITFDQCLQQRDVNLCISHAFDHGINLFDTAEVYGQGRVEIILGKGLSEAKLPRDRYVLCGKVFWGGEAPTQIGLHRKHIIEGCNNSLKRMSLEYMDFYLCHRPDINTSMEEIVIAMNVLIQQGKILYWGTSEWPSHMILEAYYIAKGLNLIPPSAEQYEYNLFLRERGEKIAAELNEKIKIGNMITMPLARGILSGKYSGSLEGNTRAALGSHEGFREMLASDVGRKKIRQVQQMSNIAKQLEITPAQLALSWCLINPYVHTVILGISSISQLKENLKVIGLLNSNTIDNGSLLALDDIFLNKPEPIFEPTYAQVIAES